MTAVATTLEQEVQAALAIVRDPELDEPITDLGFVASVACDEDGVEVALRLPTSFCAPTFAHLVVSDTLDALRRVPGAGRVAVRLEGHPDADRINAGLARDEGAAETVRRGAPDRLEDPRTAFRRTAHLAAMQRCCERLLQTSEWTVEELGWLTLADLRPGPEKEALLRRRADVGLGIRPSELVLVDHEGERIPLAQLPMRVRFAKAVRTSLQDDGQPCRGLVRTRYADEDPEGFSPAVRGGDLTRAAS